MLRSLPRLPLLVIFALIATAISASAQPIQVDDVSFSREAEDWLQIDVEITAGESPDPEAIDPDYVDNIILTFTFAYEVDGPREWAFYESQVRIASMESGDDKIVHFFLPGEIVERDSLSNPDKYWIVELEAAGQELPFTPELASSFFSSPDQVESFLSKAGSETARTEGMLLPYYHAPLFLTTNIRADDVPSYMRASNAF